MNRTRLLLPMVATLFSSGCADPQAIEKCEALVDAICANVAERCFPPISEDECMEMLEEEMGCEDAFDVSDDYDECMADLEASAECLPYTELPDACQGALLYLE